MPFYLIPPSHFKKQYGYLCWLLAWLLFSRDLPTSKRRGHHSIGILYSHYGPSSLTFIGTPFLLPTRHGLSHADCSCVAQHHHSQVDIFWQQPSVCVAWFALLQKLQIDFSCFRQVSNYLTTKQVMLLRWYWVCHPAFTFSAHIKQSGLSHQPLRWLAS